MKVASASSTAPVVQVWLAVAVTSIVTAYLLIALPSTLPDSIVHKPASAASDSRTTTAATTTTTTAAPMPIPVEPTPQALYVGSLIEEVTGFADLFAETELRVHVRGLKWAEGPTWVPAGARILTSVPTTQDQVIFSDTKTNIMHYFIPATGKSGPFLTPSGCYESNDVPCDSHGARRVILLVNGTIIPLAEKYRGARLNSPNDLTLDAEGNIFFTDPSYGFNDRELDTRRELRENNVFKIPSAYIKASSHNCWIGPRIRPIRRYLAGKSTLDPVKLRLTGLDTPLFRPNGIYAHNQKLYIANCIPDNQGYWVVCETVSANGMATCEPFAQEHVRSGVKAIGAADGLKVDSEGRLWATAAGGVHVFAPDGTRLGMVRTDKKTGNLAFGGDGRLYLTVDDVLASIALVLT
ncbi:uncharacterized protein MONBRDRAFT_24651 [Monosiga brevicollis MX1]|uniref:SMP-30/Gluconolactonase/LRE-like region domain-containing protein n=1 Tax=Monosiga brevicollis TaxID=81824 RepID=A9UX26_MONBE|nr:uncharacterized protein MONBRDRAFT_24651 [Monosiga brevicollis MX1]EDQ90141.1 predicted protein [Monosiga brevicollis MX1]|eukprot:XP_001744908.1 hypothetical protein [Monosiga brevicollis MX1]